MLNNTEHTTEKHSCSVSGTKKQLREGVKKNVQKPSLKPYRESSVTSDVWGGGKSKGSGETPRNFMNGAKKRKTMGVRKKGQVKGRRNWGGLPIAVAKAEENSRDDHVGAGKRGGKREDRRVWV